MENKKKIIEQFELLIKQIQHDIKLLNEEDENRNETFRIRALTNVVNIIKKIPGEINSVDDLKGIKGIGDGTLRRVEEILETGKLKEVHITKEIEEYFLHSSELEEIFGIGKKKAYELIKKYDIKTVAELKKKYKSGEIELPDNISKGLKYIGKIKENIPRADIVEFEKKLQKIVLEISPNLLFIICGSYRRQKETSNDIDIIIVNTNIKTKEQIENEKENYLNLFVEKLKNRKIIIDSLTGENVKTKYMGICKINNVMRRIDIRFIPYESYYPAILYFTGSKNLNKQMRQIAISMNLTLNEYGLFDRKNNMIKVNSEKEIFDKLGMEFLTPDKR